LHSKTTYHNQPPATIVMVTKTLPSL